MTHDVLSVSVSVAHLTASILYHIWETNVKLDFVVCFEMVIEVIRCSAVSV